MSASAIKSVTVKKQEYVLKNLNEIIPKNIKKKYFKLSGLGCGGIDTSTISRIIKVGVHYFAYCTDRKVYASQNDYYFTETLSGIHNSVPSVLPIYLNDMYGVFLITSSMYSKVYDEYKMREDMYNGGLCSVYYKGRIYMYNLSSVIVFKKFDYANACNSLEVENQISIVHGDDSSSLGLFVIKDNLYLVKQKGIYLVRYNEKFKELKKLDILPLSVVKNSLIRFNDHVLCFLNDNKICLFDGEKITYKKSMLDDMKGATFTAFGGNASCYYINVTLDGVKYTYAYNILTGEEMLSDYYKLLSDTDGIAINVANNAVVRLSIAYKTVANTNQKLTITEDLGCCGNKIITGLEIHTIGSGEIVFSGDFGEKVFLLKSGCNTVRCNMGSVNYTIKFQNLSSDFTIEKAKLKYRQCGD